MFPVLEVWTFILVGVVNLGVAAKGDLEFLAVLFDYCEIDECLLLTLGGGFVGELLLLFNKLCSGMGLFDRILQGLRGFFGFQFLHLMIGELVVIP